MSGNKIYVQGSYIDVHDNENVYLNVDKAEVKIGQQATEHREMTVNEDIVMSLKQIFFDDEAEARKFLASIQNMKSTQITAKVNELVKAKIISDKSHKHDLWNVLHKNGLYSPTESNWNQQVD